MPYHKKICQTEYNQNFISKYYFKSTCLKWTYTKNGKDYGVSKVFFLAVSEIIIQSFKSIGRPKHA